MKKISVSESGIDKKNQCRLSGSGIDENKFYEIELMTVIIDIVSFSITCRPAQDLTTARLLNTLPVR